MRIVPQSVSASYCPQLLLPAPKIAGLLPANVSSQQSTPPTVFTYANPLLDELPVRQRASLLQAMTTLFDIAVGNARGELNEQALNAALTLVRRTVTGERMRPTNPARFAAETDADALELLVNVSQLMIITEEDVANEVEAMRRQRASRTAVRP